MRIAAAALVGALALTLVGCVPNKPTISTSPSSSVFSSEEAALTAAERSYSNYLRASDALAASGGVDTAPLQNLVSPDRMKVEIQGAETLQKAGLHASGSTSFGNSVLERIGHRGSETMVVFNTCWDVSRLRFLDATSADVTPASRVDRQTLEVTMVTRNQALPLVLDEDESWAGSSLC
jgi:hypothetical protein